MMQPENQEKQNVTQMQMQEERKGKPWVVSKEKPGVLLWISGKK